MADFKDHPNKIIIREQWCKPILAHLKENLGYELTYLGLPGIEGLDIIAWIDYLDYIIAIDCGDYSKKNYNYERATENIKKLNKLLLRLESSEKISGYSLYLGYMEEVILKGLDKNGSKFSQNNLVQIYNLDFCNTLTSPLSVVDLKGNVNKYYKIEAIRKLLELQRDLCNSRKGERFIMFITVHSHFWEDEAKTYFTSQKNDEFNKYADSINSLETEEKIIRLLRYYFYDAIKNQFISNGFIPEFFPPIYYDGAENSKLICFTIAGTFFQSPAACAPFNQNFKDIVNSAFLSLSEDSIIMNNNTNKEIRANPNPTENLTEFESYKKLWKNL